MNHPRSIRVSSHHLLWAALLVAPAILGAKGCGGRSHDDGDDAVGVQCESTDQCAGGSFCDFALEAECGDADERGTCKPIPGVCTQDFTPVCGCDGMTYANACAASSASVSVASTGECAGTGDECGGSAGTECGEGTFCKYSLDPACGGEDHTGTCEPIPQACTQQLTPVCGCDGRAYDNECVANAAGVSVAGPGDCPGLGDACRAAGASCGPGQFCSFSVASGCGNDPGTCEAIPEACTREFVPVCGCDQNSYDNECLANSAGVSVAGPGACP